MPDRIVVRGAREHNLRDIDVEIPREKLVVITGLSGSGKSSLAFDTLYAEGQRRYVESLSAYARQFLEQMEKPDVDQIEGLSPAIAIEQKTASKNPRSTVATVTEIHDYLRLLFARAGRAHCPQCGRLIASQTVQQVVDRLLALPEKTRFNLYAPVIRARKGEHRRELQELRQAGFVRVRVDGELRELADDIVLAKTVPHTIEVLVDRLTVRPGLEKRLADSLDTAFTRGDDVVRVELLGDGAATEELIFSRRFACVACGTSLPEISPRMFSFNSPQGACPDCNGLGVNRYFDPDLIIPDVRKSLRDGAVTTLDRKTAAQLASVFAALAQRYRFDLATPWSELSAAARKVVLGGTGGKELEIVYRKDGKPHVFQRAWEGVVAFFERRYKATESPWLRDELEELMSARPCAGCGGARLRKESLAVRVGGKTIAEVSGLSVAEALAFFSTVDLTAQELEIARLLLKEIRERLGFLVHVGLEYLTLDRTSATLSGGEGQRIRLATQIGSSLSGVLYILDEPSIGLHQRDNTRLLATLKRLRDLGNTVLVVEHDRDTMLAADHLIDMGPGAGRHGGLVVAEGSPADVMANDASLTGRYLAGTLSIPTPATRRGGKTGWNLVVRGAREHNLKNVTVEIPLGTITCVTGVSGSGKSSLVLDTLYRALAQRLNGSRERAGAHDDLEGWQLLDKVIDIDQAPIGRTPRSNPATYTGLFTHIREVFAQLPEARARGYDPGRFSFNVKGGRCEACTGDGVIRIEMHFLPDVYVTCEVCRGRRYARETLEVLYRGKSIADVLDLTVAEALDFLSSHPPIRTKLATLHDVGLDYVRLGQAATTLSGGEAQRIKLARELARRATGRTLYILDEPTTGLHFEDVRRLLAVLERLADQGNTVVVIEHNLDVIKTADRVIDLGPEGGYGGGRVVAVGTPEEVAANPDSFTGFYLREALASAPSERLRPQVVG